MSETKINRRKAIQQASLLLGYSISGPALAGVLNGCTANESLDWQPQFFTESEAMLVEAASGRILPSGATPGAIDANVVKFIDQMVAEYYLPRDQLHFRAGIAGLEAQSQADINSSFTKASPSDQDKLLSKQAEHARSQSSKASDGSKHFFLMLKELTILGFFTSKIGATQVLNFDEIPGGYDGCKPLDAVGGKTWAT